MTCMHAVAKACARMHACRQPKKERHCLGYADDPVKVQTAKRAVVLAHISQKGNQKMSAAPWPKKRGGACSES